MMDYSQTVEICTPEEDYMYIFQAGWSHISYK
jgi:hypothetical protein